MATGNCKDCRFWESHTDSWNKTWRTCEAADWVARDDKIADDAFAIYAEALDDSGLEAGMKTGPMFGCVRFQPIK